MKLGHRTINNAAFNVASGLLPIVVSYFLWPFILAKLGDAAYGIYAVVGAVMGYFALLDLGLGSAVVKFVAEYAGQKRPDRISEVIGTAMLVLLVGGLLGGAAMLASAELLVTRVFRVPPELHDPACLAFRIGGAGFLFTMLLTLFAAIPNGLNRYDVGSVTGAVMGVATTVGTAIILFLGHGLVAVIGFNVVLTAATILVYAVIVKRLAPELHFRPVWSRPMLKDVLGFGLFKLLGRVTDVAVRQLSLLLIGVLLGVSSVTYYAVPYGLVNRLTIMILRLAIVIFPAVSELQGQRRRDKIVDLYLTTTRLVLALATALCLPLLVFGQRLLELWVGPAFADKAGHVMFFITLGVYLDTCTNVPTFVADGMGRPRVSGVAAASHAALFLLLLVPLAHTWGINGAALAFLACPVCIAPAFVWYVNSRVVGLSTRQLLLQSYLPPLWTGALMAAPLLLLPQQRIGNQYLLLFVMGSSALLYLALGFFTNVFSGRDREMILSYARHVWDRVSRRDGGARG